MKVAVVYDSWTGNTEGIARYISGFFGCDIFKVEQAPSDLSSYEMLFLGSPNIRSKPTQKIDEFIQKASLPRKILIFITYGVPLWGEISSAKCLKYIKSRLAAHTFLPSFICPGYHKKFKTYKNRPSSKDIKRLEAFLQRISI